MSIPPPEHPAGPGDPAITPDDKDWTWTLRERCPECGFTAADVAATEVAELVTAFTDPWPAVLARPDAAQRPAPSTWSPLEYACHVRDVCRLFEERLQLMLAHEAPVFDNWDQDATAVADRYGEQDPATVAGELTACATAFARALRTGAGRRVGAYRHPLERVGVHGAHARSVRPARPAPPPLGRRGRLPVKPELVYLLLGGSLLLAAVLPQLLHRWALSAPDRARGHRHGDRAAPAARGRRARPGRGPAGHRARHRDHRARRADGRRAGARPPAAVAQPRARGVPGRRPGGCSASRCR